MGMGPQVLYDCIDQRVIGCVERCLGGCHCKVGNLTGSQPDGRLLDRFGANEPGKYRGVGHFENLGRQGLVFIDGADNGIYISGGIAKQLQKLQCNGVEDR